MKYLFVDFCNTLVNFYSLGEFIEYVLKDKRFFLRKLLYKIVNRLAILIRYPFTNKKRIFFLKGINSNFIESKSKDFYNKIIRPNFNSFVVNEVKNLSENGFRLIIVSAGLDCYLRYLSEDLKYDEILATQLSIGNKKCSGLIVGEEIYGTEKVNAILQYLKSKDINLDDIYSVSYSDHISDLPMFLLSNEKHCVNPDKKLSDLANLLNWKIINC